MTTDIGFLHLYLEDNPPTTQIRKTGVIYLSNNGRSIQSEIYRRIGQFGIGFEFSLWWFSVQVEFFMNDPSQVRRAFRLYITKQPARSAKSIVFSKYGPALFVEKAT
jgi:hypothetical protein